MSNYRMSKGTTEHFTSLEEMRTAWGMKPVTKKTSDKKKLKEQQERFLSKHKCKACGAPMTYIHSNVMACKNPECKGIEIKREDKDGNEMVSYINSFCTLDDLGAEIASNIFSE